MSIWCWIGKKAPLTRALAKKLRPFETVTFTAALPLGYLAPEAGDLPGVGPPALRTSDRVLCCDRSERGASIYWIFSISP